MGIIRKIEVIKKTEVIRKIEVIREIMGVMVVEIVIKEHAQ